MKLQKLFKALAYLTAVLIFIWFFLLKIVARIAARSGRSSPCPASLAAIVDNPLRRLYMGQVLDWIGIKPGEQVLELGPGPGAFTIAAAQQVGPAGRLLAVDIQPQMIALVEQRVQQAGLNNVETHVCGAYDLPFEDDSIDRAFLISVLPEIPDPARALRELRRVLRPDGILSITAEFADPDYLFGGETARLLAENGFRSVEKFGSWWCYTINFRAAAEMAWGSSYYVAREPSMLRQFDSAVATVKPLLVQRFGDPFVSEVAVDARSEFQRLLPQLPYIGGRKNFLTFNLVSTAWFLALYRALQKRGIGLDEAGPLVLDVYQVLQDSYPAWLLRLRGWRIFTPMGKRWLQRRAQLSQERRYPGDWVFTYVPKNGHDLGVDYIECGILKFLQQQGAAELMPYLCSTDFIMSERMGLGLERTMTLGEGCTHCDFRFKRGRSTVWPVGLEQEVKRSLTAETTQS